MSLSAVLVCSGKILGMTSLPDFDKLSPEHLRAIAAQLMQRVETLDQKSSPWTSKSITTKRSMTI
jgi:hypothetical protein